MKVLTKGQQLKLWQQHVRVQILTHAVFTRQSWISKCLMSIFRSSHESFLDNGEAFKHTHWIKILSDFCQWAKIGKNCFFSSSRRASWLHLNIGEWHLDIQLCLVNTACVIIHYRMSTSLNNICTLKWRSWTLTWWSHSKPKNWTQ